MEGRVPGVLVSSTYFDLRQIRLDLESFIASELGYRPLLFESDTFPIDPDADTIENCRQRVEQNADILVLIIGGRYGFVERDSGRSVTDIEYLAARMKGIPVYVFIDQQTLNYMRVWQDNKSADFKGLVDNVKLFDFIEEVRSVDRIWTHEFITAKDIIYTLRLQFAYLVHSALLAYARLQAEPESAIPSGLSGRALRLALEKPSFWEYRLFGQVLSDEVFTCASLRREHMLGISLGVADHVDLYSFPAWSGARMQEIKALAEAVNKIFADELPRAFGPKGTPGTVSDIVFAARLVASVYRNALLWAQAMRRTHVDEQCQSARDLMSHFPDDAIERIEVFGQMVLKKVDEAIALPPSKEPRSIEITLHIGMTHADEFAKEMEELRQHIESGELQ
jgi:hypothetical protein